MPARPRAAFRGQQDLWLWVLGLFVAQQVAADAGYAAPDVGLIEAVLSHNLVYVLAYAALFIQIRRFPLSPPPSNQSAVALIALTFAAGVIVALLSFRSFDGLIALGLGLTLWFVQRPDAPTAEARQACAAAACVFFALSFNLFWGKLIFIALKDWIILGDSVLTSAALQLSGHEVTRVLNRLGTAAGEGHMVLIVGACSAFNNMTLGALCTVAAILCVQPRLRPSHAWGIAAVCAVLLAFNTGRLSMLALNREAYLYYHEGQGVILLQAVQTALLFAAAFAVAFYRRAPLPSPLDRAA